LFLQLMHILIKFSTNLILSQYMHKLNQVNNTSHVKISVEYIYIRKKCLLYKKEVFVESGIWTHALSDQNLNLAP